MTIESPSELRMDMDMGSDMVPGVPQRYMGKLRAADSKRGRVQIRIRILSRQCDHQDKLNFRHRQPELDDT